MARINQPSLLNRLGVGAGMLASAVGFNGCGDFSDNFLKEGEYDGYEVEIGKSGGMKYIRIDSKERYGITAKDVGYDDGRFDEIFINLPSGHPLEEYANLQKLEAIYDSVNEAGETD
jgi:hypothetical protein